MIHGKLCQSYRLRLCTRNSTFSVQLTTDKDITLFLLRVTRQIKNESVFGNYLGIENLLIIRFGR